MSLAVAVALSTPDCQIGIRVSRSYAKATTFAAASRASRRANAISGTDEIAGAPGMKETAADNALFSGRPNVTL